VCVCVHMCVFCVHMIMRVRVRVCVCFFCENGRVCV